MVATQEFLFPVKLRPSWRSSEEYKVILATAPTTVTECRVRSNEATPASTRVEKHGNWARIIGIALMIGAFIAGPAGAIIFGLALIFLSAGATIPSWQVAIPFWSMLLSPFVILWAWMLAAGQKELILFLRRFGNEALNDAVRDLVQSHLRRRFRLITLDDSAFAPVGPRWTGLLVSLIPPGFILLTIALSYAGFATVAQSELEDETPFGSALALIQVGIIALGVLAFFTCLLLVVAAVRAHFTSRRTVDSPRACAKAYRRLQRLKKFTRRISIAAPMATVITTTDDQWQATIKSVAPLCKVVLLDLSRPSESIAWELESISGLGSNVVLLIKRSQVEYLDGSKIDTDECNAGLWSRIRSISDRLPLVVYDSPEQLQETDLMKILQDDRRQA